MAMAQKYLIINLGSSSKKYALVIGQAIDCMIRIEQTAVGQWQAFLDRDQQTQSLNFELQSIDRATEWVVAQFILTKDLTHAADLSGIGLRVVAPGSYFQVHRIIDEEYLMRLRTARLDAPLHITPVIQELSLLERALPNIPIVGVSDSAFHATLPAVVRTYAINQHDAEIYDIYRFGYHGVSIQSVVYKARELFQELPKRLIVCHLGSGASVTALKNGQSAETSMGFTPLEGLIMKSRVGDLDPGALLYLAKHKGLNHDELETYLNTQCGLLGLSGQTGDMRELLKLESEGSTQAQFAVSAFVHRIKKYIGAYIAILGGLDGLIFTGAIGERSPEIRERICEDLDFLGVNLDSELNQSFIEKTGLISSGQSYPIAVVSTNELSEMARVTQHELSL